MEMANVGVEVAGSRPSMLEELLQRIPQDRHLEVVKQFNRLGLRQDDEVMVLLYTMLYVKGMYEDIPQAMNGSVEQVEQALIQLGVKFEDAVDEVFKEAAERASEVIVAHTKQLAQSKDSLSTLAEAIQQDIEQRREAIAKEVELVRTKTQKLFVESMKKELPRLWEDYIRSFYSLKRIARDVAVVAMGLGVCQVVLELLKRLF